MKHKISKFTVKVEKPCYKINEDFIIGFVKLFNNRFVANSLLNVIY